jgi:hypothetical protein
VGLTSGLATLVVTLMQTAGTRHLLFVVGGGVVCLIILMALSRVGWLQRFFDRAIQRTLERTGMVRALDYELLLRIQHGYVVSEIEVLPDTWLAGRELRVSRPWDRGVIILSVKRNGEMVPGLPGPTDVILSGDILTAYGKEKSLQSMVEPLVSGGPIQAEVG